MKSFITGRVSNYIENKNVDATVEFMNIKNSVQVNSKSWNNIIDGIAVEENDKGQVQIAKPWQNKPAKALQWIKEDENIRFELWSQVEGENWNFQNEYIISRDALKAFEPIHAYNLEIMKRLKEEFSDDALNGTSFFVREE